MRRPRPLGGAQIAIMEDMIETGGWDGASSVRSRAPGAVQAIIDRLVQRGAVRLVSGRYIVTEKGDEELKRVGRPGR